MGSVVIKNFIDDHFSNCHNKTDDSGDSTPLLHNLFRTCVSLNLVKLDLNVLRFWILLRQFIEFREAFLDYSRCLRVKIACRLGHLCLGRTEHGKTDEELLHL